MHYVSYIHIANKMTMEYYGTILCHTSILYIHYVYRYLLLILCRREGGDSIVIFFFKVIIYL